MCKYSGEIADQGNVIVYKCFFSIIVIRWKKHNGDGDIIIIGAIIITYINLWC